MIFWCWARLSQFSSYRYFRSENGRKIETERISSETAYLFTRNLSNVKTNSVGVLEVSSFYQI